MKKSKIFLSAAALALAVVGFLTTKANKKFATFTVTFNSACASGTLTVNTSCYTTVNALGVLKTVFLKTAAGNFVRTMVTAFNGLHRVFKK